MSRVYAIWNCIIDMLPREPRSYDTSEDTGFWTNGYEILCSSELEAEIMYQFLDDVFRGWWDYTLITGYYDPFEDYDNDETDDYTGFYYIRLE